MYLILRRKVCQHKVHRGVGVLLFDFGEGGFAPAPVAADHHDARSHVGQSHCRGLAYARGSTSDQADLLAHDATELFGLRSFHPSFPSLPQDLWRSPAWHAGLRQISLFYALDKLSSLSLSLSFTSAWADSETNADGSNPLAISHTPMNISHRPPGIAWIVSRLNPRTSTTDPPRMTAYPTRPQTAKNRGTNFDL